MYIGDSGGVYVLRVDSGDVVVLPKWVYRDGRVEVEAVGGKVSLYHFEGIAPSSGPMGMVRGEGLSGIYVGDGYVEVEGEGELKVYGSSW